jgi:hypothetical protein
LLGAAMLIAFGGCSVSEQAKNGSPGGPGGFRSGSGSSSGSSSGTASGSSGVSGSSGDSSGSTGASTSSSTSSGGSSSGGSSNRKVTDLIPGSAGMTMAVDSGGVLHVAASALVSGSYAVVYAECAGACDTGASWKVQPIQAQPTASLVPTIGVTQDGRPRILYASDSPAGYIYLECNANCAGGGAWSAVQLSSGQPEPSPVPPPRLPFAVSPGGRVAFPRVTTSSDPLNNILVVQYCASGCSDGNSWSTVTVGPGNNTSPRSIAFGSDESLALVASLPVQQKYELSLFDCTGDCSAQPNWSELDGLWTARDDLDRILAEVARTPSGQTRLVVRAHDPTDTTSPESSVGNVIAYRGCDSACGTGSNWTTPILVPAPAGSDSDIGFALALDGAGRPTIAFATGTTSGYARCTGDCTGTSGLWSLSADVNAMYLDAAYPETVPATCTGDAWLLWMGPALALDGQARPILAVTAQVYGVGGQCGSGSSAITTDSFFSLP